MPTYIILSNWTQEGIQNVQNSPDRLDSVRQMFRDAGGKLKSFFMTMGRYDVVVVVEAPDDEAMARLALIIGGTGAVRTETLRAFTEAEYRGILGSLA